MEIWDAANKTQSHVMMVWWEPDVVVEKYYDSPGEFVPVEIYKPTVECIDSKPDATARCMDDPAVYRGPKEGGCSEEIALLKMAISSKLRTVQEKVPEPVRSGAYRLVTDFRIDDLSMNQLFWNLREYAP